MTSSDPTPPAFEIRLLGSFSVHIAGTPVKNLGSRAGNALLAFLALHHGQIVDRSSLADSLWPNSTHTAAMDNLRHCLVHVRRALGAEAHRLQSPSTDSLSLDLSGAYVDVHEFERLILSSKFHDLVDGFRTYTGRLFKECKGEWIMHERERLQGLFQTGLGRIAAHEETSKAPGAALEPLVRAFHEDQTNETVARALMKAYAAVGSFDAAAETFSITRTRLRHAFKAPPTAETTALNKQILSARLDEERRTNCSAPADSSSFKVSGSIPQPLTRLVGRDEALLDIQSGLDASRLVTLTGVGGIGKTQLAVAAAHASIADYPAGVWFVDLSSLRKESQIPGQILSVLQETISGEDEETALYRTVGERSLLLVLDNCEHLVRGISRLVTKLLERSGSVRILATSRHSLRVPGEKVCRVPALSLPKVRLSAETESVQSIKPSRTALLAIMDCSAIRLFAERGAHARRMFAITVDNVACVVEICRPKLDGIPLAIEMAAAWVRSPLEQIRIRLDNHFELMRSRDPSIAMRHRTLYAAVDWNYNLLSSVEQSIWRQISVFTEGFTLEVGEAIVEMPHGESQLLDVIAGLIDASVLTYSEQNGVGRYALPETLRQFGLAQEDSSGCRKIDLRARFVQYFASLGETAAPNLTGADQASWLDAIDRERGNLRAAFEYADRPEIGCHGLRLAAAVWRYYYVRGYYAEGYNAIVGMLKYGADAEAGVRALAETAAGNLAFQGGEVEKAKRHFETSLNLYIAMLDKSGMARSMASLALIFNAKGDYACARTRLEESRTLFAELGDTRNLSAAYGNLAVTACHEGDYTSAYRYHNESILLFRETGDMQRVGMALANLAGLYTSQREFGPVPPMLIEALEISLTQGSAAILAHCLLIAPPILVENGMCIAAAVCAGADTALRKRFHLPLPDDVAIEHAILIARIRDAMEPGVFQELYERGEMMDHDEIVTYLAAQLNGIVE